MTEHEERIVDLVAQGLDKALMRHISKLFDVLMASSADEQALERVRHGVDRAIDAYNAIHQQGEV